MKRLILLCLVLTAGLVVCGVSANAQMMGMPGGDRDDDRAHGRMMDMGSMDKMADMMGACMAHGDKIGLTEDQLTKIKPLHIQIMKKYERYRADVKIAEIELDEILDAKDFDLNKATSAVNKIGQIKTAYRVESLKALKEMRMVMTGEQFQKLQKMMFIKTGE